MTGMQDPWAQPTRATSQLSSQHSGGLLKCCFSNGDWWNHSCQCSTSQCPTTVQAKALMQRACGSVGMHSLNLVLTAHGSEGHTYMELIRGCLLAINRISSSFCQVKQVKSSGCWLHWGQIAKHFLGGIMHVTRNTINCTILQSIWQCCIDSKYWRVFPL